MDIVEEVPKTKIRIKIKQYVVLLLHEMLATFVTNEDSTKIATRI